MSRRLIAWIVSAVLAVVLLLGGILKNKLFPHWPHWAAISFFALASAQFIAIAIRFLLLPFLIEPYRRRRLVKLSKNFLLRFLTNEQKETLRLAAIPFTKAVANGLNEGIVFGAPVLKRVLRVLNARVVSGFTVSGDGQTEELILRPWHENPELRRWNVWAEGGIISNERQVISAVRDILAPEVRRDVVVHSVYGHHEPIVDDKFHVFLYSSPAGGTVKLPPTIWHVPTNGRAAAFAPSGTGLPIIDESTRFVVAELVDNCLYLHADVLDASGNRNRHPTSILFANLRLTLRSWRRTAGKNPRLGLLVRILQHVREELRADQFLAEITAELKSEVGVAANHSVVVEGFGRRQEEVIRTLARNLLSPVADRDVLIVNCNDRCQQPVSGGSFNVFFSSSPSGSPILDVPELVWGYRLFKPGKAFAPSALGVPIADESGFIAAEVLPDNLYLHHAFMQHGTRAEAAMLARLFVEAGKALRNLPSLSAGAALASRIEEQFVAQCRRHVAYDNANGAPSTQLQAAQAEFSTLLQTSIHLQHQVFRGESAAEDEFGHEFDLLTNMARVLDVKVNPDYLVVTTDLLYCTDPRTKLVHEIGAFDISIPRRYGAVIWKNRTRVVSAGSNDMNAPHVGNTGAACLGNMKDVYSALIEKRQYSAAVEAAIAFIESVNVGDAWGRRIDCWPVANARHGG